MGRLYAVTYNGTITAAGGDTDLVSIQPADDKPVLLRGFSLSQISEVGDAAEEGLRITVRLMPATFTVGSGGSAITAAKPVRDPTNGPAWGATVRCNDTTVSTTSGTALIVDEVGWNVRNSPFERMYPADDFCLLAAQTQAIVIRQETTAADDYTICFVAWFEEVG